jgi:DNA-binding Xre family transcriptional regulator
MQVNINLNEDDLAHIKDLIKYVEVRDSLAEGEVSIEELILGFIRKGLETAKSHAAIDRRREGLIKEGLSNIQVKNLFKPIAADKRIYQTQIHEMTGITKKTVNEAFNNKGNMSMNSFIKIWLALGCPEFDDCIQINAQKD